MSTSEQIDSYVGQTDDHSLNNQSGDIKSSDKSVSKVPTSDIKTNNENNVNNKNMDFDELLPYVGEFGLYQKGLFILMIPFTFFVAWVYFTQIFITLVPENYWCKIPELENFTVEQRIALGIPIVRENDSSSAFKYSKCFMYNINYTEIILNESLPIADPSWPIKKCQNGWEYNFTDIPYETVSTQYHWVCDDAALPTFAQSTFFVGAIFGGLIFGWIADRFGRVPALISANMVGCVAGVFTAFANSFWTFALARFFVGLAFDNCFSMMYILVLEYVGPKWRTFVANMSIAIFFTFAACILPWVAYYLADWRLTSIVLSVPLALSIATPLLVPESARWLVSQGQVDKAIGILKKFEKINGTHVPESVYKNFKESCELSQKSEDFDRKYSVIDLFRSPRLRKIVFLLIIIWMAISLVFDGHVRNVDNLGLDVFITFTIASATELPADTFLTLVLDRWGRRWLAFGSMAISGVFSIWACAVSNNLYSAALAIMGRFCVNISYNIGLQYAAELLPTVVRAQGIAFIHIMGSVASIISPFIVYLAVVSPVLPLLLLGIFGIIGGFLALLLPETLDQELPQTLQDGEDFGKDQGIWDMPCFMKKTDDDPGFVRSYKTNSVKMSDRLSLRGEAMRSSLILKSSVRSRKITPNTAPIEVVRL